MAGSDSFGTVRLTFTEDSVFSDQVIKLKGYQYIKECKVGATVYDVPELETQDFKTNGEYVAYMYGNNLYLKGNLDGACIDLQSVSSYGTVDVFVQDDTTMSGNHCLLYNFRKGIDLHILPGKTLTMNLERPGTFRYTGAIRTQEGGDVTITGGGTLNINFVGDPTVENGIPVSGIDAGKVTLEYREFSQFVGSPTVNINMNNGESGPEGDAVTGISAGTLTVKDGAKLNIEVTGRALNTDNDSTTGEGYYGGTLGRVNMAISATQMKLLNDASVDIISHANVISDIRLWGGGEALTVDTTGHLTIVNEGNIQRYDPEIPTQATYALYRDYPTYNIYFPEQNATANLVRAEGGVSITSYSAAIDDWYEKYYTKGEEDADNWAIGCHGADPTLGQNMYRGNLRIGDSIKVEENSWIRNKGSIKYIWAPQGVATVKKSPGLTMDSHAPTDNPNGSQLYYAKVMEPKFNDIYVVHKGADLSLEAPEGKGKFLYWYDALHPEGSGNGTSWTKPNQTFSSIQQDMVLVPVRDPMKTGPNLSAVSYTTEYDRDTGTTTRYAYQDMTFEKEDNISNSSGYRVMLVPAQLPRYGENTYAVEDLKGSPVMGLSNSRLYADAKPSGAYGTTLAWENIPEESYRIAYDDDETGRCFFSKPFTFDPPVAPPYISPGSGISEDNNHVPETVTITVERNKHIEYRVWNSSTNKWTSLQRYTGPIDVNVSVSNDVRIEAYAGSSLYGIKSEAYYAVRPTGTPTVKYGETNVGDGNRRYFYDSIDLTVEAPEGYEVYYRVSQQPYESSSDGIVGTKVENGKVTITDSGNGSIYFKLAKAFTVDGVQYRKLSHNYASVHLSKLTELPAPKVTVTPKSGGAPLNPDGNTYTMTENVVKVELTTQNEFPLNATIAYDTNGNARPTFSKSYTEPFDVRGAGTVAVFTLVPKAGGGYDYERKAYTFKLAESLQTVPVSTYGGNCTSYYLHENGNWVSFQANNVLGYRLKVGTKVKIVPNPPSGQVFKQWEISNYEEWHIWGTSGVGDYYYSPELVFHVPKPQYSSYGSDPKTLGIKAKFADAAEASISGQTLVGLDMSKAVGESISLWDTSKEMRTISCQWWEGDSVGAPDDVLPGAVKFDPDKTYTVKVTIKANPGASFTTSAGVAIGSWGGHFTVPNGKITRTNDTLTFTATPVRQINLTMPAPLTVGDPLPTIDDVGGLPAGVTVQKLEWPYISSGGTVPEPDHGTVRAALTLKTDGTRPILTREYPYPTVNGEQHMYERDSSSHEEVTDGSTVRVPSIDLPVKPKGVEVSGTIKSYGDANEAVTVTLTKQGVTTPAFTDTLTGNSVDYSFETVPAGDYTLKVEKKGHAPWTESITVDGSAVAKDVTIHLIGDVNGDGDVDLYDLLTLQQYLAKNITLTETQLLISDVTKDDKVDLYDLLTLQQYLARNITSFD